METLELLGVALGLGTLAGLNLYLTVFVTGLAVQQGWIALHTKYESLAILGDPVVVTIAGILFFLEFFADKVPWVDSLWDSIHTVIRPIGGALLAITVLGDANPVFDVIIGLLAGGMALTTHGAKAGTRLLANASPEPFSNIGLSLAEDATVIGGLALIYHYPIAALIVAVVAVGLALWFAPRLFAAARTTLWLLWRRVVGGTAQTGDRPELPPELEIALARAQGEDARLRWACPCVSGPGAHLKGNRFGWLLLLEGPAGGSLQFARRAATKPELTPLPVDGWKATHRAGWIRDRVVLYHLGSGEKQTFQFDRSRRGLAAELVRLVTRQAEVAPAAA